MQTSLNSSSKTKGQLIGAKSAPKIFSRTETDRPIPSCLKPLFQNEAKCETIDKKMLFYSPATKTHFHKIGFDITSF